MTNKDLMLIDTNATLMQQIFGNIEDKGSNIDGKTMSHALAMSKIALETKHEIVAAMSMVLPETHAAEMLKGAIEHADETSHIVICDIEAYVDRNNYSYADVGNMCELLREVEGSLRSYDDLFNRCLNFEIVERGKKARSEWIKKILGEDNDTEDFE